MTASLEYTFFRHRIIASNLLRLYYICELEKEDEVFIEFFVGSIHGHLRGWICTKICVKIIIF